MSRIVNDSRNDEATATWRRAHGENRPADPTLNFAIDRFLAGVFGDNVTRRTRPAGNLTPGPNRTAEPVHRGWFNNLACRDPKLRIGNIEERERSRASYETLDVLCFSAGLVRRPIDHTAAAAR